MPLSDLSIWEIRIVKYVWHETYRAEQTMAKKKILVVDIDSKKSRRMNTVGPAIDLLDNYLIHSGAASTLTKTEFELLYFLAQRPGQVFTRDQIIKSVKGEDYPVTDRSVDVQIVGLRRKLGDAAGLIETVKGIGYRFRARSGAK